MNYRILILINAIAMLDRQYHITTMPMPMQNAFRKDMLACLFANCNFAHLYMFSSLIVHGMSLMVF